MLEQKIEKPSGRKNQTCFFHRKNKIRHFWKFPEIFQIFPRFFCSVRFFEKISGNFQKLPILFFRWKKHIWFFRPEGFSIFRSSMFFEFWNLNVSQYPMSAIIRLYLKKKHWEGREGENGVHRFEIRPDHLRRLSPLLLSSSRDKLNGVFCISQLAGIFSDILCQFRMPYVQLCWCQPPCVRCMWWMWFGAILPCQCK